MLLGETVGMTTRLFTMDQENNTQFLATFELSIIHNRRQETHTTMTRRQSAPITEGYQVTNKDVEQLRTLVAQAFQESQRTIASHRKLIVSLANIQERAVSADLEIEFNKTFCKCLNRVLPVKRTEKAADRVVKLVEGFSRYIQEKCK